MDLPELPPNARYLIHSNECFDWGTHGWALETEAIDIEAYKHFIFINSSVRGPFIPPYLKARPFHCCMPRAGRDWFKSTAQHLVMLRRPGTSDSRSRSGCGSTLVEIGPEVCKEVPHD